MLKIQALLARIRTNSHNKLLVEELSNEIDVLISGNFLMNHKALHEVLQALCGPDHYVRELQYTRSLPGNAINTLVTQFNDQIQG